MLITVQICDLFLDSSEHSRFSAFIGNTKNRTELFIKVCNTDGRKIHVFHVVLVRVQTFGKAPESIGFSHARKCSEDTDTTDVLQMVETYVHLVEIL
jgi:hypothetical protein